MELSRRLQLITGMIDRCESVVDVGTDHGYVPIELIKRNICEKAIAADINKGPVEKAAANIRMEKLQNVIECRLGSGLSTVKPGEVNGAVIAGMGGNLIRDIIVDGNEVFRSLSFAVLQPVQNAEVLRKFAYESGLSILDEELCFEENKFYEILKVKAGRNPAVLDEIYYEISPILIEKKHPVLKDFLNFKLKRYMKILGSIDDDTEAADARKREVAVKIDKIKELLACL